VKPTAVDDRPTLAALGILAFALADVSHEAIGHGLATLAVGGKVVLLTTCNVDSTGTYSKWIPAAGGLMNLTVGLLSLAASRFLPRLSPHLRYFLLLVAAFNLFFAFGYPAYSGIARFGDWAAVISGLEPSWFWRVLLVVVAVAGYYGSMQLLAKVIAPFTRTSITSIGDTPDKARLRRITNIPFIAALVLAGLAGSLNPRGLLFMLTAGLPAAAAAAGLTQLDHLLETRWSKTSLVVSEPMQRSYPWIVAAGVILILFVAVLGPGIRFP
jgi:hypothetical protein